MQTRIRTNAKTAYMGLIHYAPTILCRQTVKKGLPHTYLSIFSSEIIGLFNGVLVRLFRSLDQNGHSPHKTKMFHPKT